MDNRDIVAIGASTGGVQALRFLASRLPTDFAAIVLVTIHLPSTPMSHLDRLLTAAGPLPARFATEGERVAKGRIYIAPPERHLLIESERLILGRGPRENRARPAIDPMLRSVAACCGFRAVGLVLTGALDDGAAGLCALSQCGGITLVQDPSDAICQDMPLAALGRIEPDHVAALADIPALLQSIVAEPAGKPTQAPSRIRTEVNIARDGQRSMSETDRLGKPSVFVCPDCGGTMWEIEDGGPLRFRCHIGHAYSAGLLNLALDQNLRYAMGMSLRTLDERIALARRLGREASTNGYALTAANWAAKAQEYEKEAEVIVAALERIDELTAQFVGPEKAQA